jgi:hypothetical protein
MTWLLVLASGLGVAAPLYSGEPNEQQAPIAEITRVGGRVEVDETSPEKPVVCVSLSSTQVTNAGLLH